MSRPTPHKQKLYCYVDESGQDPQSAFFVVVTVVTDEEQQAFRQELSTVERQARTGYRKWHKSRPERRLRYLELVLHQGVAKGEVFFGHYQKPLPYFFPILDVLEQAITARVHIDGIDRKKAAELTNALRARGISLGLVRSARDESESIIRLADMWAGCIRAALLGRAKEKNLLHRAQQAGYLGSFTTKNPSW